MKKKSLIIAGIMVVFMVSISTAFYWNDVEKENIKHKGKHQFEGDVKLTSGSTLTITDPLKEANSKEGPWIGSMNVGTVDPKNVYVFEDEFMSQSGNQTADDQVWLVTDGFSGQDDAPGGEVWLSAPGDSLANAQVNGESFQLTGGAPLQYEARLSITDADKASWFAGLAITDTSVLAAVTDAIGFRCPDDTGDIDFCVIQDGYIDCDDTTVNLADDTMIRLGFSADGAYTDGTVIAYINGTSFSISSTFLPHDEALTPTFELEITDTAADAMKLDYVKVQQAR